VDQASAGHRLDHRADALSVDLLDSAGEGLQRVDIRWNGELVKVLSAIAQQADVEPLSTEV
jgi:hypothetical protein